MMVEKQAGKKLNRFRAGNGLDVCQGAFEIFCSTGGIVYHRTDAWKSPQPRGTAERTNEVPCDRARGMLSQYGAEALEPACFLGDRSPSYAIECRASFAGLAGSHVDDSHWIREFGCPKRVHVRDGQRELGTGPCVYLGYASEAEVLWCNDEIASADKIDRDVTSIGLVLKANEQRKMAIAGPDRGSKKQGVELGDAKQSSLEGSEQQLMESTIDGDRRQTMSQVVEDLQRANRRIDTKSERFGAFSGESLGHWLLGVRLACRDLLAKNKAECSSVHDGIEDAMRSTRPGTESVVTRSLERSRGQYLKRTKRAVEYLHGMVVRSTSRGTGASTRGFDDVKTIARPVDKFRRRLDLVDGGNTH